MSHPLKTALARSSGFSDYRGTRPADNPLLNPPKEAWFVQATKGGHSVHLTPEMFPFCRSKDEALDRVRDRLRRDPAFARLFKGYRIYGVRLGDHVEVR